MLILALDASTLSCSAALARVSERGLSFQSGAAAQVGEQLQTASDLPKWLSGLLRGAHRKLTDIDAYGIGLSASAAPMLLPSLRLFKSLALAHKKPLVPVSSLEALAMAASTRAKPGSIVIPLLGKAPLLTGVYRVLRKSGVDLLMADQVLADPLEVLSLAGNYPGAVGCGEGYETHREAFAENLPELFDVRGTPSSLEVARLCYAALQHCHALTSDEILSLSVTSAIRRPRSYVADSAGTAHAA